MLTRLSTEGEWLGVGMVLGTGVTTVGRIGEGKEKVTAVVECWVTKP